jgi:uncharacterized protein (UPF0335 family)
MSETTINLTELEKHLPELEALWQDKDDATLQYAAGIDAVSEECGIDKKVLRKLVTARKKDKTQEALEESQELADVIAALGG